MAGHNISLYLDTPNTWEKFQKACEQKGKEPFIVLQEFINEYSDEVLGDRLFLEDEIAKGMVEAKKIVSGEVEGRNARDLLNEI